MDSSQKNKWMTILMLLIVAFLYYFVLSPKIKKAKYFNETVKMLHKDYKIKINKDDYIAEYKPASGWVSGYYYIKKKNENFKSAKSKYLKLDSRIYYGSDYTNLLNEGKYEFFSSERDEENSVLFDLIKKYGFGPYFMNEFIYDKTKGNDFEKIEEVLSKYIEKDQFRYSLSYYVSDNQIISFFNENKSGYIENSLLNVDIDSEEYDKILEIDKKFTSYFSVERDFEKIDWYEFKKYLNIKPILCFVTRLDKKELEKVKEAIKPYYNKDEYTIYFSELGWKD